MREELDELLCKRYPEIFKDRKASMKDTCMCWGFSHDDGWFDIIDCLCGVIMWPIVNERRMLKYYLEDPEKFKDSITLSKEKLAILEAEIPIASQVKEKFGGLRFYINNSNDKIRSYINMAESMSFRICEVCGDKGKLYQFSWHKTLCEKHAIQKYGEKRVKEHNESKSSQED